MAEATNIKRPNSGVKTTTNDETAVGIPVAKASKSAVKIYNEFKKVYTDKNYSSLLFNITGNVSDELYSLASKDHPLIFKVVDQNEKNVLFHLNNGIIITIEG